MPGIIAPKPPPMIKPMKSNPRPSTRAPQNPHAIVTTQNAIHVILLFENKPFGDDVMVDAEFRFGEELFATVFGIDVLVLPVLDVNMPT